ncbi:probable cytochrome P450 49a1 isoform X1 [Nilaparvata lugens]|uniref:probable cytochrome P450 49a1 isoform X1 n=1 Tax=Nilaparvata lugens TaxID=108931 RepID=UPI00193E8375|nr:probable cytochrome P450 49a1 isoform X1 [Nilaparvata lugens]XP_039285812.1 probable cytochrome P450 49a1 isoform X1 [Nilaparvata lugens]XP_039285813.1 probable cytochrome P450 49a1 isoform X1 [Nilaparvata lugens]
MARLNVKLLAKYFSTATKVKPYDEIPTLPKWPILGHAYLFFPNGKYKLDRLGDAILDLSESLGNIFKLNLNGSDLVVSLNPDDARSMYAAEGKLPFRPSFPALAHYRKKTFGSIGVVPGNGEEWLHYRKAVLPLLKGNIVAAYADDHKMISSRFVNYIRRNRGSNKELKDVFNHLLKFAIEATSVTCPGVLFECLDGTLDGSDVSNEITKASVDFMEGMYGTLVEPPVWKIWKTKSYKKLEQSHTVIHRLIADGIEKTKQDLKNNPNKHPFMVSLFENATLTENEVLVLAMEVFLGGLDATPTTLAMALHYLSQNPEAQARAFSEVSTQNQLKYVEACLKETLRMAPSAGASSRYLAEEAILSGYLVPANTLVAVFSPITSRDEKYFHSPMEFIPERWFRENKDKRHPFASIPFGFGARVCPGRHLVNQEMLILLTEILRNFKLDSNNGQVGMIHRMNRIPDQEINIFFTDR